jgi:fructose-bisphosphate aldolase, class I
VTAPPLLVATARALVAPGKGVLAADESTGTITRRFAAAGVAPTAESRRAWRDLLFSAPAIGRYLSGVILFDETIHQAAADGTPFVELLAEQGVLAGIKVDQGTVPLAGFAGEMVTEGIDGLRERLSGYAELGARFAKWRAVITIGPGRPTSTCVEDNTHLLARYAALCQEAGLVPIVEPEVLMDGAHTIEHCATATEATLRALFRQMAAHRVDLEAAVLKPNMVLPGLDCPERASAEQVAEATVGVLRDTVPASVPGIVFLSGGQSDIDATARLDAINRRGTQPWQLSFSYSRALQNAALSTWKGQDANREAAQAAFLHRARMNAEARQGLYQDHETQPAGV